MSLRQEPEPEPEQEVPAQRTPRQPRDDSVAPWAVTSGASLAGERRPATSDGLRTRRSARSAECAPSPFTPPRHGRAASARANGVLCRTMSPHSQWRGFQADTEAVRPLVYGPVFRQQRSMKDARVAHVRADVAAKGWDRRL